MANNPYVNKVELADGTTLMDTSGVTVDAAHLMNGYTALDRSGALITGTASGGGGFTEIEIQITSGDWDSGADWPSGANTKPLGESLYTCDLAEITEDVNGDELDCAEGDDFKVSEYSQARCPAPLWVYVGDGTIYVATREECSPSQSVTIRGLILHQ